MKKPLLTLRPGGESREFEKGTPLIDALEDMGAFLRTPCGGKGVCGKCGVLIESGAPGRSAAEDGFFPSEPLSRLACRTAIVGDMEVHVPAAKAVARPGKPPPPRLRDPAVALDIGTTMVQLTLVERADGATYPLGSFLNPQRRHGHDIIGRIAASADPAIRESLTRVIRGAVAASVRSGLAGGGMHPDEIGLLVVSGNTTMTHLFLGIDVRPLGTHPYTASELDYDRYDSIKDLFPSARIAALPSASAFLGGDLVGGLAISDLMGLQRNVFFIDIGTNGEMFLRDGAGTIHATSCAMGPALEGMNISSGMTADEGAINHFTVENGSLKPAVIGGGAPVGISGTGIIDALAIMLREGVVGYNGAINRAAAEASAIFRGRVVTRNGTSVCLLGYGIAITQKDIRNIQLARGASLAAARLLLKDASYDAGRIDHVLIAGALGENLDIDSFRLLGFLPDFPGARYRFLGNTSLAAAERSCVDPAFIRRCRTLRDEIRVVELSARTDFNDEFIGCLNFR
ncbi:MAG TPA: ASKHA domain-containing protein [Spirochaetota bacterium]|nr:ASKHA domain-containing protein [Spirochaetota bacterium]